MSEFRETFTRQGKKEGLLKYDDAAAVYFGLAIVLVILVPLTIRNAYKVIKGQGKARPGGFEGPGARGFMGWFRI